MQEILNPKRHKDPMTEVADGWVHPSLHHPCTEEKVEIHRYFNANATTIDQAPS
jgi:hypothetical protein